MFQTTATSIEQQPQHSIDQQIRWWRCLLPLAAQALIVISIPAQNAYTLATGTTVYLQTAPVDPYDVLRGRYVTLGYVITRFRQLDSLPGWSADFRQLGTELYLVIEPSEAGERSPWQAVAIHDHYPQELQPQQQVIKGHWRNGSLQIGLSEYYIPEAIGDALESDMRQQGGRALAEVKVDGRGHAALVQLWVEDRVY
jgi:uncharacterized membrane-anchored protein